MCAVSVYQMMRGFIVIITAALSVTFLKEKRYCFHWLALCVIVFGVIIVGIVGINDSKEHKERETPTSLAGIVLILIA